MAVEMTTDTIEFLGVQYPSFLHTERSLYVPTYRAPDSKFRFRKNDVIIVSFPRSGTTWLQEIVCRLLTKNDPSVEETPTYLRAPWVEHNHFETLIKLQEDRPRRVMTTHLPGHYLGPILKDEGCTVLHVVRNLTDVLESWYHFHKTASFLPDLLYPEDFMKKYSDCQLAYGDWYSHTIDWIRYANDRLPIFYKNLQDDLKGSVRQIDEILHPNEEDRCPSLYDDIVLKCSFDAMKKNPCTNYTTIPSTVLDVQRFPFLRSAGNNIVPRITKKNSKRHATEEMRVIGELQHTHNLEGNWRDYITRFFH